MVCPSIPKRPTAARSALVREGTGQEANGAESERSRQGGAQNALALTGAGELPPRSLRPGRGGPLWASAVAHGGAG